MKKIIFVVYILLLTISLNLAEAQVMISSEISLRLLILNTTIDEKAVSLPKISLSSEWVGDPYDYMGRTYINQPWPKYHILVSRDNSDLPLNQNPRFYYVPKTIKPTKGNQELQTLDTEKIQLHHKINL